VKRLSELSLFYTTEYLLHKHAKEPLFCGDFYENAVCLPSSTWRTRFLLEASTFFDSGRFVGLVFDAEFASILLAISDEPYEGFQNHILRVSSVSLYRSRSISPELVTELAPRPHLLKFPVQMLDLNRYVELNKEWIRCVLLTPSSEQLETAHPAGSWPWKRYLLLLETFDAAEF